MKIKIDSGAGKTARNATYCPFTQKSAQCKGVVKSMHTSKYHLTDLMEVQKTFNKRESKLLEILYVRSKYPEIDKMLLHYEYSRQRWWYKFFKLFDRKVK